MVVSAIEAGEKDLRMEAIAGKGESNCVIRRQTRHDASTGVD